MLPFHQESDDKAALLFMHSFKMILCYLFEVYPEAVEHADQAEELAQLLPGNAVVPVCNFFGSLSRLALYDTFSEEGQKQILANIEAHNMKT